MPNGARECAECAYTFDSYSHGHYCDECDVWRCEDCGRCGGTNDCDNYDDDDDDYYGSDRRVHSWNYRPSFDPKGDPAEVMMGVELEVGGASHREIADVVRRTDDSEDHLYMKEDGSISGVEIVTHPMTLTWARQYPFATVLRDLRRVGCQVDDGYGLHVHVARAAFRQSKRPELPVEPPGVVPVRRVRRFGVPATPPPPPSSALHQMMWLLFLARNSSELEQLARRVSRQWAGFKKPEKGELKRKAQGARNDSVRYVAVNCTNRETFELRFFKSTLSEQEFYAALEFADASVRYTRQVTSKDVLRGKALTWPHFTEWVKRHNYKNLAAEISR